MNILLISPSGSDIYAKLSAQLPPLGLGHIAAVIREKRHEVKIMDLGLEGRVLTRALLDWSDVAGISAETTRYPEATSPGIFMKRMKQQTIR